MLPHRRKRPSTSNVADDCEAYLHGGYAERRRLRGEPVPVWAWVNLLAHGTADELAEAARDGGVGPWSQARAFVAGELVDRAGIDGRSLEEFQSEVLVPLELRVLARPASARWQPDQLVAELLEALPEHPSHH